MEDSYSKDELLTRYLNIVYFGLNAYGIQAACTPSSAWTRPG